MATRYAIIDDILYKTYFYGTFLRCLDEKETNKAMEKLHDHLSGGHFNGKDFFHKLLGLGYYWPYMENDCILHIKKCEKYQENSNLILDLS